MTWRVEHGDCIEAMCAMDEASVDAIVCDPPYGLEFMGKAWDSFGKDTSNGYREKPRITEREVREGSLSAYTGAGGKGINHFQAGPPFQRWCTEWAREALRVLKPGGHLIAFGGTRTYHRLAAGIEDAGFEIRDCLVWLYGSGFPKSLDVSKAIDRAAGVQRTEVVGVRAGHEGFVDRTDAHSGGGRSDGWDRPWQDNPDAVRAHHLQTAPATPEAEHWQGWCTALKPGHEPIVLARKPLTGTVAANVLEHGTGAINVDGCRIGTEGGTAGCDAGPSDGIYGDGLNGAFGKPVEGLGRWPANVILDPEAAAMLDEQSGTLTSGANPTRRGSDKFRGVYSDFEGQEECEPARGADQGGASRFFYCAKTSSAERNAGLDVFEERPAGSGDERPGGSMHERYGDANGSGRQPTARNIHPTVKPIELMRWLVRLVTPPGGLVLDPFTGSGTTGCATVLEGFDFIGCERDDQYIEIARARIAWWDEHPEGVELDQALQADKQRRAIVESGQLGLLDGEAA